MNDSVRGTFTYRWRIDVRKLLVGFAGLAIAACQSDVMEAVPETPNDRAVTELLALMGSTYDENSDDRLRSALGLPSDFPIGAIVYATVDGGSSGVSADFLPPECSIRDGATREEAEEFTRCHECPRSYSCGSGIQGAAVGIAILGGPVAEAQQVVEVDFEVGRTIIDDEWRSMFHHDIAVDWARQVLYVRDDEEPEGIMAFSLETGEWVRTLPTPTGDGPRELTHGFRDLAVARGGGIYASGLLRVIEFDASGEFVRTWTPNAPTRQAVCDLAGAPAVPTQGGVVRRGPDGDENIGPVLSNGRAIKAATVELGVAISQRLSFSRIACSDGAAYVVSSYDTGPDSVFVYRAGHEERRIAVPTDSVEDDCLRAVTVNGVTLRRECPVWSKRLRPSFDDLGNLVLIGSDKTVQGAIINPETGCYAMVRTPSNRIHRVARIHADSALVFRHATGRRHIEGLGEMEVTYGNSANGVSLHPLRRVTGEPCPGMLPSVG